MLPVKRHHTRFSPTRATTACPDNNNNNNESSANDSSVVAPRGYHHVNKKYHPTRPVPMGPYASGAMFLRTTSLWGRRPQKEMTGHVDLWRMKTTMTFLTKTCHAASQSPGMKDLMPLLGAKVKHPLLMRKTKRAALRSAVAGRKQDIS